MRIPTPSRIRRFVKRKRAARALARKKRAYRVDRPAASATIAAFIVGCQRSGTTMLGRILDEMMEIDHFPEGDPRAFFDEIRIRDGAVRDRLLSRSTAVCAVFKPICESHRVLELMADHPNSRAIWIFRHWKDVVNSVVNVKRWGDQRLHVIRDLPAGTGDWGWRHEGISDECRADVTPFVRPDLTYPEAVALFWYVRNRIYFDQQLDRRTDVLPVKYEELVTQPQTEFKRICEFLGAAFQPEAVATIHARSINKEACPVQHTGITQLCDDMYERLEQAGSQLQANRA